MAADLALQVLALPAEIYNKIYFFVFTAGVDEEEIQFTALDKSYKPPPSLQVNQASRTHFPSLFYGNTIFTVCSRDDFLNWFNSLDRQHVPLLRGF